MIVSEPEFAVAQLRAANYSVAEIAGMTKQSIGVVQRTCNRPSVRALIADLRSQRLRGMLDTVESEVAASIKELARIRDEGVRDGDRARAAIAILDWFAKLNEAVDVLPRIAAIEAKLQSSPDDGAIEPNRVPAPREVPAGLVADDPEE